MVLTADFPDRTLRGRPPDPGTVGQDGVYEVVLDTGDRGMTMRQFSVSPPPPLPETKSLTLSYQPRTVSNQSIAEFTQSRSGLNQ